MTKQNKKMGRPRKEFDTDQFEKLCGLQCTLEEVSGWFGMSEDTLNVRLRESYGDTFQGVYKKYSQDGKISLRRHQFRLAEKSAAMAIWLGKQYLGQRETDLTDRDKQLAETEYVILSPEEKEEAKQLLQEFEA